MSQPLSFGPNSPDPLASPVTNIEQLRQIFIGAERPAAERLLGIEYEIFAIDALSLMPLPYEGPRSISTLFKNLCAGTLAFKPIYEDEHIVALTGPLATIALEPGGQIEIALKPAHTLKEANQSLALILDELSKKAHELSVDLLSIGIHPLATRDEMAVVKKKRYDIMRDYMGSKEKRGVDMMTRTCSIQLNLDFMNESDMVQKMRLGACLMPFYSLLCSSGAFIEGEPTKRGVERAHIWFETDRDRTGFPAIIFADNFGYQAWIDYALDVPMYFIRRDENYIDVAGASFRDFIAHGLKGQQATLRDFADHLTTVFTEVRLKPFLELRSPDCLPEVYVSALSAMSFALFYNEKACTEAMKLFANISIEELNSLHRDVMEQGRKARFRNEPVFSIAEQILAIAEKVLKQSGEQDLLLPFKNLIKHDITVAEILKQKFPKFKKSDIAKLVELLNPLASPLV